MLAGVTAGGLGDAVGRAGQLAGDVQRHEPDISFDDAARLVPAVLRDGLLVALADAGWEVEPREPAAAGEPTAAV